MDLFGRKKKRKASKHKGVYKCGRKWKAQIQVEGVQHYLGVFDSEQLAVNEYIERAAHFGRPRKGSDLTSCDSTDSRLLQAKIALGKGIRDLAEINYQLSCALALDCGDQGLVEELTKRAAGLLEMQGNYLDEIYSIE